jgi:hypothetical protein
LLSNFAGYAGRKNKGVTYLTGKGYGKQEEDGEGGEGMNVFQLGDVADF